MTTEKIVTVTHRYSASAERVFDAWLDPKRAAAFLFATPTGTMVKAEIDARVGGAFCFVDRRDGEDVEHIGTYLELERPRRLSFTFQVPKYDPRPTRVTIEIAPRDGGCELTLTHRDVPSDYTEQTTHGWTTILDTLERALG